MMKNDSIIKDIRKLMNCLGSTSSDVKLVYKETSNAIMPNFWIIRAGNTECQGETQYEAALMLFNKLKSKIDDKVAEHQGCINTYHKTINSLEN
jgi:hypothetical protein